MTKSSTDSEIVKVDIKGSSRLAKKTIICHTVDDIKKILLTDILNLIAILRNHIDIDVNKAKQIKVFSMQVIARAEKAEIDNEIHLEALETGGKER
ncbi:8286_t:CDS:2 [Funneliformis geosporum]|uniref:8286_t:CDS:1 n=1 Tax=Funneliformis geosporum TaxID=1117311 RepID=A0A9W4SNZ7_9GLOM|nr:8286_t:CDS:2 [Funneliformis geosporum]